MIPVSFIAVFTGIIALVITRCLYFIALILGKLIAPVDVWRDGIGRIGTNTQNTGSDTPDCELALIRLMLTD